VLIVIAAVIVFARFAGKIFPVLIWATIFYFVYRLVRGMWLQSRRAHAPQSPGTNLDTRFQLISHHARERHLRTPEIRGTPVKHMSARERLTELLGSLLIAAVAAMVIGFVMVLLRGQPPQSPQYAWVAIVSTLGAWGVLFPAKFWELKSGEAAMRRFVMLIVGLMLGWIAYALSVNLRVELPFDLVIRPVDDNLIPKGFYSASGSPLLYAYLAYFGFLFLLLRWWRVAERERPARFSLWSTMSALFVAWLLNFVWPFPQPWGLMVAATMSIATQLASPWSPSKPKFRTANNI
jgi:hypothetical protein